MNRLLFRMTEAGDDDFLITAALLDERGEIVGQQRWERSLSRKDLPVIPELGDADEAVITQIGAELEAVLTGGGLAAAWEQGAERPVFDIRTGDLAGHPAPAKVQRIEDERTGLKTQKERTAQHLEDAEAEAMRLRERRDAIVRPDKQLWIGIGLLLYSTLVSIVHPGLAMAGGPTSCTPGIRLLAWLFVSSLVWLLQYMTYLAARLPSGADCGTLT